MIHVLPGGELVFETLSVLIGALTMIGLFTVWRFTKKG